MAWGAQPDTCELVPDAEARELHRLVGLVGSIGVEIDLSADEAGDKVVELFFALRALERAGGLLRDQVLLRLVELPADRCPSTLRGLDAVARAAGVSESYLLALRRRRFRRPPPADRG